MPLDSRFVTGTDLEELFRDKDTGEPLAFGTVEFFQDDNRVVPKLVYTLQNAANPPTPPNYTYVPLPNPITLSAIGTISDNNGNNVPIYYFPFDGTPVLSTDTIQLYYVVIRNSLGIIQFTREAWPNTTEEDNPIGAEANLSNQLSNPQFVDINFKYNNPSVIPLTGVATDVIPIAPRWDLVVNHTATTTVTVQRNAIAGSLAYPGNPPYTLTITPGLNIAALSLRQRLDNNPDIFGRAAGGANGFIASSILLAPASNITMTYQPNGQPAQILLAANNLGGVYAEFTNTVQLTPANNPSNGDTGFVDVSIILPIVGATTLSNVQIVGVSSNVANVNYDQVTSNREKDQLFNYYNPLLQYKPIQSYLIGWDFPLNPAQFLGSTLAASAAGANTSRYVWDQTIVFQSANNGPAISRPASGALRITATNATQFALIQYLPQSIARELLNNPLSVNVAALTPFAGGLAGTISLWYTTGAALPSTAANNSIVATLDANGYPATFNLAGGQPWVEVPRSGLGNARFTVANSATTQFNDYGLFGWNANGIAGVNTATFFAIVIGFAQLGAASTIDFGSISLVPGSIPTRPGPEVGGEAERKCMYFYQKSFNYNVVPVQNLGIDTFEYITPSTQADGVEANLWGSNTYPFAVPMYTTPTMTLFNPAAANAQIRNETRLNDFTLSRTYNVNPKSFTLAATVSVGTLYGDACGVHWTADARLGL